jgi:DNA-binding transcriptional regulator/RsmH inhibitor MraZ
LHSAGEDNVPEAYQKVLKSERIQNCIMTIAKQSRLVSIPKSDLDSLEATIETLENEYVMDQLERSEQDIQNRKVRNVKEFLKEL